jgi:hypothetical protein
MSTEALPFVPSRFADRYTTPGNARPDPFCTDTVLAEDLLVFAQVTTYICDGETAFATCAPWQRLFRSFYYTEAVKKELEAAKRLASEVRAYGGPTIAALCRIAHSYNQPDTARRQRRLLEIADAARDGHELQPIG